jgi:hypothetical protein
MALLPFARDSFKAKDQKEKNRLIFGNLPRFAHYIFRDHRKRVARSLDTLYDSGVFVDGGIYPSLHKGRQKREHILCHSCLFHRGAYGFS